MKNTTNGAKHFSEIVNVARQLTTDIKDLEVRMFEIRRLTENLLIYQMNKPTVTINIY